MNTLTKIFAGLGILVLAFSQPVESRAADWDVVATFDASKASDLVVADGAGEYIYSVEEIPATALLTNSVDRKIIFGGQLNLRWTGAMPDAGYKIKATFLSDSEDRCQRIEFNGRPLEEKLSLPKWKVIEREWTVPAGAISDGDVTVTISRVNGANAVLSRLEILSDARQKLSPPPALEEILAKAEVPMPRLTPRPVSISEVKTALVSLSGTWKFNPAPPDGFAEFKADQTRHWSKIEVPGEWAMQGFQVKSNSAAAYWREFNVPADWQGRRIKLRFDTVHSDCRVFVNGHEVGAHEGCFTAFELDITDAVKPGRNTLALTVKSESTADTLASATQYAAHQLGGITRKVQLFAVPEINIASQNITTTFDKEFHDAKLGVHLELARESSKISSNGTVAAKFILSDPRGAVILTNVVNLPAIPTGQTLTANFSIPVAAPEKWDSEHPNLYSLKTELLVDGLTTETISQRMGFRQIDIRGNQLLVNGVPVKLRGACRHEVDPVRGRSLTPEDWKQDARLFRAANVNYIRTSHYPPPEEFLELCDEYGFFVECEAPLCWVEHGANPVWQKWNSQDKKFFNYLMRANLENLAANRNHPGIIIWSLANESRWNPLFAEVNRRMKSADPTRPTSFHDQCWGNYNNAHSRADIAVYHYPDEHGPEKCDAETRPVLFGEYCHVECYNRRELATDPGVRDDWGRGFQRMSDLMYLHDGCLGGAIWAGIDDVFCLPDGKFVGYGMWGCICDGWRREKPEFWHVKKTYSPVRVLADNLPLPAAGNPIHVPVENRYNFADLNEVGIAWNIANTKGKVRIDLPARHSGEILIPSPAILKSGDVLHLTFTDPRGFVCDEDDIAFGEPKEVPAIVEKSAGRLAITRTDGQIQIKGVHVAYVISRKTGQFTSGKLNGKLVLVGGPALMVLPLQTEACEPVDLGIWKPLNQVCENWEAESVTAVENTDGTVEISVKGSSREAGGTYVIHLDASGGIQISYDFSSKVAVDPRQWGMVFFAPEKFSTLHWDCKAQWSFYPADHIGRAVGTAAMRIASSDQPYATHLPDHIWPLDATGLGGNDFSSTKVAIHEAFITDRSSRLCVNSDGHQSIRAFIDDRQTGLLVTGFHTGGGEDFFSPHFATERKPLKPGSRLSDTIQLQLADK